MVKWTLKLVNQKKIKVLYIEDDPETRSLMSDIIGLKGHEFHEAERGITGIKIAKKIRPVITALWQRVTNGRGGRSEGVFLQRRNGGHNGSRTRDTRNHNPVL